MHRRGRRCTLRCMSDDRTDPYAPGPPPEAVPPASGPGGPPPKSGSHGWAIAGALIAVLALGGLVAAVIDRGDSGTTSNTDPAAEIRIMQTNVNNTTTVTPPAATVTVENQVTVTTPTVTTPAKKPATTTPASPAETTTTP